MIPGIKLLSTFRKQCVLLVCCNAQSSGSGKMLLRAFPAGFVRVMSFQSENKGIGRIGNEGNFVLFSHN